MLTLSLRNFSIDSFSSKDSLESMGSMAERYDGEQGVGKDDVEGSKNEVHWDSTF